MKKDLEEYYKKNFEEGWYNRLYPFLQSNVMEDIRMKILTIKKKGIEIFPSKDEMFNAFKLTPYDKVKVVIIGQDPYYTDNHAHGLAFSSKHPKVCPPSLKNIFKEIDNDIYAGKENYINHNSNWKLDKWAEQGILLLNTALTVEQGTPGSHIFIWKPFIAAVLNQLSKKENLVYLLWGSYAKQFKSIVEGNSHILEAAHPSPLSAYNGFFGCKHFSKTNQIVAEKFGSDAVIKW